MGEKSPLNTLPVHERKKPIKPEKTKNIFDQQPALWRALHCKEALVQILVGLFPLPFLQLFLAGNELPGQAI
jgi:predicted component of type VI protein secretion system